MGVLAGTHFEGSEPLPGPNIGNSWAKGQGKVITRVNGCRFYHEFCGNDVHLNPATANTMRN